MNELEQKVMKYLAELAPGKVVNISGSDHYDQIVEITKRYIDNNGDVEFSSDYTKIRKLKSR